MIEENQILLFLGLILPLSLQFDKNNYNLKIMFFFKMAFFF